MYGVSYERACSRRSVLCKKRKANGICCWSCTSLLSIVLSFRCWPFSKHCITVHWGLEGHPIRLSRDYFDEITSHTVPGPLSKSNSTSAAKGKANKLRQFLVPSDLNDPLSKNAATQRHIRIFAAIVCPTVVFAIIDFARLVRIFITSRDEPWKEQDFMVGSNVRSDILTFCSFIWRQFLRVGTMLSGSRFLVVQTGT